MSYISNPMNVRQWDTFSSWQDRNESAISELWSITTGEGELDNDLETFTDNLFDSEIVKAGNYFAKRSVDCGGTGNHLKQSYFESACELLGDKKAKEVRDAFLQEMKQRYPQGWSCYPGDTCKHGVFIATDYDCACWRCEVE